MATYKIPPDPRETDEELSTQLNKKSREPIPWKWLGMGILVTILGVVMALTVVNQMLERTPLPISEGNVGETAVTSLGGQAVIVLTAPPNNPTPTSPLPTPSPIPTFTPIPTPDVAVAPDELTVGFYAIVANTDDFGVTIRGGPSTSNAPIVVADEGTILLILGGPENANTFLWWQVQLNDGTEGWVAGQFLLPSVAP